YDVAHPRELPIVAHFDDDAAEILWIGQPSERAQRVLKGLARRHGRTAERTSSHLHVLLAKGIDHVARRKVAGGHLLGIDPGPHAVVELPKISHIADAFDLRQLVANLDGRVVAALSPGR